MTDIQLGIKITADGSKATATLSNVEAATVKLKSAAQAAAEGTKSLASAWEKLSAQGAKHLEAINTAKRLTDGMSASGRAATEAAARAEAFSRGIGTIHTASQQGGRSLEQYAAMLGKIAVAYVAVQQAAQAFNAALQASIQLDRLNGMMSAASNGAVDTASNLAYVRTVAQQLGIDLMATADSFASLTAASKGTTLEGQQTRDIFLAIAKAAAALGKSSADTSGMLMAVSQMISKGTVSAEELRQQLGERLPGAFQMAAKAMGMTTVELDKQMSAGNIMATDFLPKLAKVLDETYSKSRFDRLNNEISRLDTAWTTFKQNFLDTASMAKTFQFLAGGLNLINSLIEKSKGFGTTTEEFLSKSSIQKALAGGKPGLEPIPEQSAPLLDGVKKSADAANESVKKLSKSMQDIQARGGSIIATGSKYLGMGEGNQSSILVKFLNEYSGTTAKSIAGDVNAWCARFVSAVLGEAKIGGLPTMSAKAYAGYGQAVWKQGMSAAALSEVMPGDIAVFTRKGGGGHVGFVKATDPGKGLLDILGGNQSDKVSVIQRSMKDLIAIRRVTGDAIKDFDSAQQAIEKEKSAYEKAVADKKRAQDEAFASLKLHQDDAAKAAEEYASIQVAKINTSIAALKAEEDAQQRVTAAELASAKTIDEKQAIIASAAQQSAAFHDREKSLILAEIDLQQKALAAKRAAYVKELSGAQSGQYAQDEAQQLALKQAIRAVDTDLAQLAQTRAQAEINANSQVNEYAQQSLNLKQQEAGFIEDTIAAYQREMEILQRLTAAKEAGASADQLGMLRQYYEQGAQLPDVVTAEQLARVKQYQLSTLAVKEAVDALTKSTNDQKDAEQSVREEQLRQNAYWDQLIGRIQDYATLWNKVSTGGADGFATMAVAANQYIKQIDQIGNAYDALRKKSGGSSWAADSAEAFAIAAATLNMVGNALVMVRDQYKEGTAEYQKYQNAAGAVAVAAKIATLSEAILSVVHQMSSGDPYTAIPRALAVAGMLASMGISTGAGGASGGMSAATQKRQDEQGTGSVFGDTKAQSQSITNALEAIRQNSSNDLNYSAAMLRALEDLNSSILALANNLVGNVMPAIDTAIKASGMKFGKTMLDPFSGFNKELTDQGIGWFEQSLSSILSGKFQGKLYADITKSFEIMGSAVSSSTKTYIQDAGDTVNAQITRIFRDIVATFQAGAEAFGITAGGVMNALKGFKVGQQQISLKDMNLEEQQKALSAVFSKITDDMASQLNRKLKLGLAPFEKAGEGMAQTFLRVADGINQSQGAMEQLGMTAISYKDIVNKQGDVAAEIARQTIEAQGQMSAGVKQYVHELTGSAEDIIAVYQKLVAASNLMKTAGFGDANLDRTMINAAGGLDAFITAMQSFNDNFLTEAQRFAGSSEQLGAQFAALGVAMPASKDAFAQLMLGIDQTTDSGKKLFGALLKLNPEFTKLADQIQGIKDRYADILNPFGKFGAQIKGVSDDFGVLLKDLSTRNQSAVDAFTSKSGKAETESELATLRKSRAQKFEQLKADQAEFDRLNAETDKKKRKQNATRLNELLTAIREGEDGIRALDGFISTDMQVLASINQSIDTYRKQLESATAGEKSGIIKDAATVMADTLGKIFTEIQQTVTAAQQRLDAVVTFQDSLATQIASLQGPDATTALMRSRAAEAQRAVDTYWANMGDGAKRNTEEELRLLGEAQQAIMDKYNAELAAVQQLQQAVEGFNSAIASLKSQIATLQGPGAVATLAGQNYSAAMGNIADYRAGIAAGGTRDYAKEVTLINAAQTAVMDKYNAEMALVQQAAQEQAQALQDNLQIQIDAINASTQAQIDGINAAADAQIESINAAADAQAKAAQTANDAQLKALQDQLQAAQQLTAAYKQIAEYAKNMKLGNLTNLSPEAKLAEAQRQYQDTLSRAQSGDADAAQKLTGASDAYLEAAKSYYGSGSQYSNIFDGVQAAMQSVGGLNGGNPDSIQAHIDALKDQQTAQTEAARTASQAQIKAIQDGAKAQTDAVQQAAKAQIDALQKDIAQQIKDLNDPDKNAAMKALKDAAVGELQALQQTAEEAKKGAEQAAGDAAKAAEQYKTDTLNALKAIADKAENTRQEAARQYEEARATAERQFNDAYTLANNQLITLGLIGGFNAAQNAALIAIAQNLVKGWTPPAATPIQAKASGGYAQAGLALVGEKGPELVRFERPAQVLTAQQTREALTGDSPKTFAALEAIKTELKAIVTTQSNANPQLIERLANIEDRLNKMERNQRLQA